jgi:hypothetical protein
MICVRRKEGVCSVLGHMHVQPTLASAILTLFTWSVFHTYNTKLYSEDMHNYTYVLRGYSRPFLAYTNLFQSDGIETTT